MSGLLRAQLVKEFNLVKEANLSQKVQQNLMQKAKAVQKSSNRGKVRQRSRRKSFEEAAAAEKKLL